MAAVTVKAEVALLFCSDFLPVESKNEVFLWTGEVLRKEPTEGSPKPPDSFRWVILFKKKRDETKDSVFRLLSTDQDLLPLIGCILSSIQHT